MKCTAHIVIAFLFLNLICIGGFWYDGSGALVTMPWNEGGPGIALGRIAGLLLQYALLIQLVLIGRIGWIERAFGHDGLNRIHRLLGYSLLALLVLHPLLLSVGYGALNGQATTSAFIGLTIGFDDVLNAVIGVLLLVAVIALSVPWVRRRLKYERWYVVHLLTYIAVVLSWGHQLESGGDFGNQAFAAYWMLFNGTVFGAFILWRFVRPLWLWWRHRFVVDRVVQESPDAWSVYLRGKNLQSFRFRAGQFMNVSFLQRELLWFHPFSFSHEYDGHTIRFTIKALGDGTTAVSALKQGTVALLDGPLGVFTPARARTGKYLLIAGGIGVTPIRAILGELAAIGADVEVVYAVRSLEHGALLDELRQLSDRVHLVVSDLKAVLPPGAVAGRINAAGLTRLVPDVAQRDVFVCGPEPMMDAVTAVLRSLGVPDRRIISERFGY
jgi:predicted ferric reductase